MSTLTRRLAALASPLALMLGGCVQAQPLTADAPTGGPALWQVADEDTTIYLFGTVHALPAEIEWFKGPVADALGASGEVVTELPSGAVTDPAAQQMITGMAMLPADKSLRDMLTREQRAAYETALGELGLPPASFDRFEPWFAGMTLTMLPLMKSGYSVSSGVEQVVDAKAGASAQRAGLETVEFQMGLFDTLPEQAQVAFLMSAVENTDKIVPLLDAMVAAWQAGDAEKLAEMMNASMTDPVLAERLLYQRNRNWAEWIDERLDRPGTVFVAVGAGHLAGSKSVQDYLSDRGLTPKRVQ